MSKYKHYLPKLSDSQKKKMRAELAGAAGIDAQLDARERKHFENEYEKWEAYGINYLDVVMVGPFSAREILENIGLKCNLMLKSEVAFYVQALDKTKGVLMVETKKDERTNKTSAVISEEAGKDKQAAYEGFYRGSYADIERRTEKFYLTRWDRFWGFFGIKTDHALSVEINKAGLEAYEERVKETNKKIKAVEARKTCNEFIEKHKEDYNSKKDKLKEAVEPTKAWEKLFFGENIEKAPEYTFDNGVTVSALSLGVACVYQKYKYDLSAITPEQAENSVEIKTAIENIGRGLKKMAEMKHEARNKDPRMKYLDDNLFEVDDETKKFDRSIIAYLKSEDANEYKLSNNMKREFSNAKTVEEKDRVCAKASVFVKTSEDMTKIFGKDDTIFNEDKVMTDGRKEMITSWRNRMKQAKNDVMLYEAVQKEDYDKVFDINGDAEKDYGKLDNLIADCDNKWKNAEAEVDLEKEVEEEILIG